MSKPVLATNIHHNEKGLHLDHYLQKKFPRISNTAAKMIIRLDGVWINDILIRNPGHVLQGSENIRLDETSLAVFPQKKGKKFSRPPVSRFKEWVLYQDQNIMAINKPPGVNAQTQVRDKSEDVLKMALEFLNSKDNDNKRHGGHQKGRPQLQIAHRIDRNTSGLLIFTKTNAANKKLTQLFRGNNVRKEHLVLVKGKLEKNKGTLKNRISKNPKENIALIHPENARDGKLAVSHFEIRRKFNTATLLLVSMETDFSHQLRAQLAHEGHPIIGDPKYGGIWQGQPQNLFARNRMAFHAYRMKFEHPFTRKNITLEAPLPKDFEDAMAALKKS